MGRYSATKIANSILSRAFADKIEVNPMKLQKLLALTACAYGAETGEEFLNSPLHVWDYGPVERIVYDKFHVYGSQPIETYWSDATGNTETMRESASSALESSLDLIWRHGSRFSAHELAKITTHPGSAWHQAFTAGQQVISPDLLAADRTYLNLLGAHQL